MKHAWGGRAVIVALVGIMVLSADLVLMDGRALAEKSDTGDKDHSSARDLSGVTQNWDKVLPVAQRFVILAAFNNDAVRDNETGLVWEKSPTTTAATSWLTARHTCANKIFGGRKGWRLPSILELASLIDTSILPPGPTLPPGHPFLNVQSAFSVYYWSATTDAQSPTTASWGVQFYDGLVDSTVKASSSFLVWCVRGPMNADTY